MRSLLALFLALFLTLPAAAQTGNPAEQFVSGNIRAGLAILNDTSLDTATRSSRFEAFLLENTDLARIALFTLARCRSIRRSTGPLPRRCAPSCAPTRT